MSSWPNSPIQWSAEHKSILLSGTNLEPIKDVTLQQVIDKSSNFPVEFPVESVRCYQLKDKVDTKTLERNINSVYPIIHEHVLYLCTVFLLHQRKYGTRKEFYKDMSLVQLIDRLLKKRAVSFMGPSDFYLLLNGRSGNGNWESIGTPEETPPLLLETCLSYDEIKLSALLSVSSYTHFLNSGDRNNSAVYENDRTKVEENGIIIGLIGPRFEKPNVMEFRDIIKTDEPPPEVPTFQTEVTKFYASANHDADLYLDLGAGELIYQKRVSLSFDTLLLEANERAKQANKKAYVHVVGLGLGVWRISPDQDKLFMNAFAQRLEFLAPTLSHVSDVRFAHIRHKLAGAYKDGDRILNITLHMNNMDPQQKLTGSDAGKLLVVSYAWDGNAHPGNEFWRGSLNGSGDPAAACSTQVAELHNAHINPVVCGRNLRVATLTGVVTLQEYQQNHTITRSNERNSPVGMSWPSLHKIDVAVRLTSFPVLSSEKLNTMTSWPNAPIEWGPEHKSIILSVQPIEDVTLEEVIEKSSLFPVDFPVDSVRSCQLKTKVDKKTLERNINSAYPIIHEYGLYLCVVFLVHQRKHGFRKEFYKNMSLIQLIDRLLKNRAVSFVGRHDYYLLMNGKGGGGNWESIGTPKETPPLLLKDYLSYDEIKLSALLSVSSYTHFINDGSRRNHAVYEADRTKLEENGIIIGLIGPRLHKPNVMENSDMIQSDVVPTFQTEVTKFYSADKDRYLDLGAGKYLDTVIYQKRVSISIDTLLLEANERAKQVDKKAFVHVVGLGLGVWRISPEQDKLFMDAFAQRLEFLAATLSHVSDVRFAYIHHKMAGAYKDGDRISDITLHMDDRNPHEKLTGPDAGKLLVVSYAWDGNAQPGNEFWSGNLSGSGDSAAACSTQVAELHNAHINPIVCGRNLRVATLTGVVPLQEYQLNYIVHDC